MAWGLETGDSETQNDSTSWAETGEQATFNKAVPTPNRHVQKIAKPAHFMYVRQNIIASVQLQAAVSIGRTAMNLREKSRIREEPGALFDHQPVFRILLDSIY
jgi:hypothetical protein